MSKERQQRFEVLNNCAVSGLPLEPFIFAPELEYLQVVSETEGPIFRPVNLSRLTRDNGNCLPFIIDSYRSFPNRIDLSFDAAWKAFEALVKQRAGDARLSSSIDRLISESNPKISDVTSSARDYVPWQVSKYITQSLFGVDPQLRNQLDNAARLNSFSAEIANFVDSVKEKYDFEFEGDEIFRENSWGNGPSRYRRISSLVYKVFRSNGTGESLEILGSPLRLNDTTLDLLLLRGFLNRFRNDRFHGNGAPILTSSATSLATFSMPYFAYLVTYHLVVALLSLEHSVDFDSENEKALIWNLGSGNELFGKFWNR